MVPGPVIFTQVLHRPRRKLILIRGKRATGYFEFCEEMGCAVWGKLLNIKDALGEPIGMWMPECMRPADTSRYTQGVEVSADYSGELPEGMEIIDLPECSYLFFHSQPYPEEKMGEVIGMVQRAMDSYNPEFYGWEWADNDAPRLQLSPLGERGYIEARPVRAIKE